MKQPEKAAHRDQAARVVGGGRTSTSRKTAPADSPGAITALLLILAPPLTLRADHPLPGPHFFDCLPPLLRGDLKDQVDDGIHPDGRREQELKNCLVLQLVFLLYLQ